MGHPALYAGDLLDLRPRLEALRGEGRLLDPVELEVADAVFGQVVTLDVPALFAVLQPVGLDRAFGELVLVLLVVLEVEHPAAGDRFIDDLGDFGIAAARGGDLQPLLGGIVAEGLDDLGAGALQAALRQVVAEEVDRRDQGLGLERQQAGGAGEIVAVGLRVDIDLIALDFGVEDVGAAAEVDDVEQLDVFLELFGGQLKAVPQLRHSQPLPLLGGLDQEPGERDEAGEALGPDRRLAAPVRACAAGGFAQRPVDDLGRLEAVDVAVLEEAEPALRLLAKLVGAQDLGVLAPAEDPGDQLPGGGVVGLE